MKNKKICPFPTQYGFRDRSIFSSAIRNPVAESFSVSTVRDPVTESFSMFFELHGAISQRIH